MENMLIISVLAKNRFGALTRVSNVFSRRGVNIKQITAGETTTKGISRITILVTGDDLDYKQLDKQLKKIEDVVDAVILPMEKAITKELLLVKIKYTNDSLKLIQDKLFECSGKIVSFDSEVLVGQIVGSSRRIDNFLQEIKDFKIIEMCRSGVTALDVSNKTFNI